MKRTHRQLVAVLAGLAATGIVGASASGLGGIKPSLLGADTGTVSSCDSDGVDVAYTTSYNPTTNLIQIDTVTVSGVNAACAGLRYEVVLTGNGAPRTVLGTASGTANGTGSFSPAFPAGVNAAAVTGIAITITT